MARVEFVRLDGKLRRPLVDLDALPDDDLLEVLSYLSVAELLNCRRVCRRWRDLALHPALWRNKKISTHDPLIVATLRKAPCLNRLKVFHREQFYSRGRSLVTTNCAASYLRVEFPATEAVLVALILSRQASLGRLKHVWLTVFNHTKKDYSNSRLQNLLQDLLCTSRLESVRLDLHLDPDAHRGPLPSAALQNAPVQASLRQLAYGTEIADSNLPLYLEWHAATLEVVWLMGAMRETHGLARLLAAVPRLGELMCPLLEDIEALLPCPALRTLRLYVNLDDWTRQHLSGAHAFLSAVVATLEHLHVHFLDGEARAEAVDLLYSLQGPLPGALRSLNFTSYSSRFLRHDRTPPLQLVPLVRALPRLPLLAELNIGGVPSDAFLLALDGKVLPHLRTLSVRSPLRCRHEWAHGDQVRRLLDCYPLLHVVMLADLKYVGGACDFCKANTCHLLVAFRINDVTLFRHPPQERCGVKHGQDEVHLP